MPTHLPSTPAARPALRSLVVSRPRGMLLVRLLLGGLLLVMLAGVWAVMGLWPQARAYASKILSFFSGS